MVAALNRSAKLNIRGAGTLASRDIVVEYRFRVSFASFPRSTHARCPPPPSPFFVESKSESITPAHLECRHRRSCNREEGKRPCDTWPPVCRPAGSGKSARASMEDTCRCRRTLALSTRSRSTVSRLAAIV